MCRVSSPLLAQRLGMSAAVEICGGIFPLLGCRIA
jgi:hypothetical protein